MRKKQNDDAASVLKEINFEVKGLNTKLNKTENKLSAVQLEITSYERILERKLYAEQKHEF